jgi:hypothetical protein
VHATCTVTRNIIAVHVTCRVEQANVAIPGVLMLQIAWDTYVLPDMDVNQLYEAATSIFPMILGVDDEGNALNDEQLSQMCKAIQGGLGQNKLISPFFRDCVGSPLPAGVVKLIAQYDDRDTPGALHAVMTRLWQENVVLRQDNARLQLAYDSLSQVQGNQSVGNDHEVETNDLESEAADVSLQSDEEDCDRDESCSRSGSGSSTSSSDKRQNQEPVKTFGGRNRASKSTTKQPKTAGSGQSFSSRERSQDIRAQSSVDGAGKSRVTMCNTACYMKLKQHRL